MSASMTSVSPAGAGPLALRRPCDPPPVRVAVLLAGEHFHSPVVLRAIARAAGTRPLVVTTPKFTRVRGERKSVRALVAESGLRYLSSMAFMKWWFHRSAARERAQAVPLDRRRFLSVREAIAQLDCEHAHYASVADEACLERLEGFAPRLLFSVFFNQFVPERAIERVIAQPGGAAYNVHPSPLPDYRGISPAFWTLADGARHAGATVHELTPVIDQGRYVARARVPVLEGDSVFRLYRRSAEAAAAAAASVVRAARAGRALASVARPPGKGCYRSTITPDAVASLRRRGRSFFRWARDRA